MQELIVEPTSRAPAIRFSPEENVFYIRGTSSPEDVRAVYYPVVEWTDKFIEEILQSEFKIYSNENPLRFQIDLTYFNSASAKFIFDILSEFKRLPQAGIAVKVEWHYDEDDTDLKEAGIDFSQLLEMKFLFIPKTS